MPAWCGTTGWLARALGRAATSPCSPPPSRSKLSSASRTAARRRPASRGVSSHGPGEDGVRATPFVVSWTRRRARRPRPSRQRTVHRSASRCHPNRARSRITDVVRWCLPIVGSPLAVGRGRPVRPRARGRGAWPPAGTAAWSYGSAGRCAQRGHPCVGAAHVPGVRVLAAVAHWAGVGGRPGEQGRVGAPFLLTGQRGVIRVRPVFLEGRGAGSLDTPVLGPPAQAADRADCQSQARQHRQPGQTCTSHVG